MKDIHKLCGWIYNPREVERVVSQLMRPIFNLAAPHLIGSGQGKDVFLWKAEETLTGKVRPPHHQTIGDCVSHGFAGAIDDLRFVRMAWQNQREAFIATSTEAIYAGSRVEIGGGRIGNSDGSLGGWGVEWLLKYGILHRLNYNEIIQSNVNLDLRKYSGQRAKQWGSPRSGVPDALESIARDFPLKTGSLLTGGYREARDAIAGAKCPVVVCSNPAFDLKRDNQGFCKINPRDQWPHCVYFRGVSDNPKRPGIVYQQSWGPDLPSGPLQITMPHGEPLTLPAGAFFVDAENFDLMVRNQECYVLSDMVGYPARPDSEFQFKFY